ncbi:MAG: hypothetical protein RBR53_03455 [Desulforegulaceae bacterium]|nr:hypothetical protein [Desulforegulaceae bacterium]
MKKNIVVFTTGSSGSSVLTGLIATQGYWLGEETKKLNFDTYENSELVDLNIEILKASGFGRRDCNDIPPPSIEKISQLKKTLNPDIFQKFIDKCNANGPWLWKDPRLSYTIHFWDQFSEVNNADFIFIDRDPFQSYSGLILSRKIPMSFKEHGQMNSNYHKSYMKYLENNGLFDHKFVFEDLIINPQEFIKKINKIYNLNIEFKDLTNIYKGVLFKKRYRTFSILKAFIYYYLYRYLKREKITFPRRDNI